LLFRHPSLELLVPEHNHISRKSSAFIAISNLVATVCGGGVLSLPQAFQKAGIVPSTILMIMAAVSTDFSMYILVSCARRTGGRSYGDVTRNAFGPLAEIITTLLLIILLFLVIVAYMVLLTQLWSPIVLQLVPPSLQRQLVSILLSRTTTTTTTTTTSVADDNMTMLPLLSNYILAVLLLILLPLLWQTDLHALRYTCYVGLVSAIVLTLGVTQQALARNHRLWDQAAQLQDDSTLTPSSVWQQIVWVGDVNGINYAFPIIVLSFFSIYNVLSVHSALFNPTRSRVKFVIDGTIGICFV
jgi:amino acid permease